ncbi:MAG: 50S ribosomal protein L1 [Planctomycetota bacterium]|jgi:large subunit ribosomal protein L1|nr:50S ribosomal protein L1 [Planctomycetota bacterium]
MAAKRSKRYRKAAEAHDRNAALGVEQAIAFVKARASAKFDETVDIAIKLNIDAKQADQLVRGSLSLPHGIGKSMRVIAFAEGEMAEAAKAAGAVEVGGQALVDKIAGGWMEFDVAVAHPSMMRFVGKLGKVLGPKGLMPSPKSGTVTDKVPEAVGEFAAGKLEFRNDKEGNVHMVAGKASFDQDKLVENVQAAVRHIKSIRPQAVRGEYIVGVHLSSTMGPGVKVSYQSEPSAAAN